MYPTFEGISVTFLTFDFVARVTIIIASVSRLIAGGERTRVSADTLVKMADNILAHRTGLLWLADFAGIFSSCKWCTT